MEMQQRIEEVGKMTVAELLVAHDEQMDLVDSLVEYDERSDSLVALPEQADAKVVLRAIEAKLAKNGWRVSSR